MVIKTQQKPVKKVPGTFFTLFYAFNRGGSFYRRWATENPTWRLNVSPEGDNNNHSEKLFA